MLSVQETTLELIREVKELQVHQQKQMAEQQKQMADQQKQISEMRREHREQMESMHREHREQMESMHRFNRGTRKLWVAIAKKVEWLDEDDWPEDEI